MAHFRAAIFDRSTEYIDKFLLYLKNNRTVPFEVSGFTDPEALIRQIESGMTDMLILPEDERQLLAQAEGKIKGIIIFSESADGSCKAAAGYGENTIVTGRYQSMRNITAVMADLYLQIEGSAGVSVAAGVRIYGMMSFAGTDAKIKVALHLAGTLEGSGRVLYLEPERFTGLMEEYLPHSDADLAEVIYLFKTGSSRLRETLENAVIHAERADILTAVNATEDLGMIEMQEWPVFLKTLADAGRYCAVVLGITEIFPSLIQVVQMCRKIYICTADEAHENRLQVRLGEIEQYFRELGRGDLLEKIMIAEREGRNE